MRPLLASEGCSRRSHTSSQGHRRNQLQVPAVPHEARSALNAAEVGLAAPLSARCRSVALRPRLTTGMPFTNLFTDHSGVRLSQAGRNVPATCCSSPSSVLQRVLVQRGRVNNEKTRLARVLKQRQIAALISHKQQRFAESRETLRCLFFQHFEKNHLKWIRVRHQHGASVSADRANTLGLNRRAVRSAFRAAHAAVRAVVVAFQDENARRDHPSSACAASHTPRRTTAIGLFMRGRFRSTTDSSLRA